MSHLREYLHRHRVALREGVQDLAHDERGDVPGWVLVTLMTAGLVVVIWAVAGPALITIFEQALHSVTGF